MHSPRAWGEVTDKAKESGRSVGVIPSSIPASSCGGGGSGSGGRSAKNQADAKLEQQTQQEAIDPDWLKGKAITKSEKPN